MKGERGERWRDLCSQAATEQDPDRLMELIREINELLEEKEQRLKSERAGENGRAAEG
jgi:hypothetical protein